MNQNSMNQKIYESEWYESEFYRNQSGYKLKAVISGHGHGGPEIGMNQNGMNNGILIFLSNWEIFRWNVWKDCGNNPIYPQGGTWPFDNGGAQALK